MTELHAAPVKASVHWDAVGRYEGDTVDRGITTDRPFATVDMYGTSYTPAPDHPRHCPFSCPARDAHRLAASQMGSGEARAISGPG
jgi:hypothetical protein